jgi:hypothetical protein
MTVIIQLALLLIEAAKTHDQIAAVVASAQIESW